MLTWRYNADGVSHITIPFSSYPFAPEAVQGKSRISAFLDGYSYATTFFEECTRRKVGLRDVVDLNFAYAVLWGVIRRHEKLMACANLSFPFNMKIRIRGVWRRIPFIDTENYRNFISQFGIPIIQDTDLFSPPDLGFYNLSAQESGEDADIWTVVKSCLAFGNVCHMMGLPFDNKLFSQENWFLDINSLAEKAKKVQQQRTQKYPN